MVYEAAILQEERFLFFENVRDETAQIWLKELVQFDD